MKALKLAVLNFLSLFLLQAVFAQSGRIITPPPTPESAPTPEIKKELPPCEEGLGKLVILPETKIDKLGDELNKYGNCGYRVGEIIHYQLINEETYKDMSFSGYFQKDENKKYEYSWFISYRPGEAQTLANNLAEKGFYWKKTISFMQDYCTESPQTPGAFFLFEREVGVFKKKDYKVLDGIIPSARQTESKQQFDELVAKGFRPVAVWWLAFWSYHLIVMERDEAIKPEGEYTFSNKELSTHKRMTELAKSGYRLVVMGADFAILNRVSKEPLGIEYEAIEYYNHFTKRLPRLLERGILDVKSGISYFCDANEDEWFFIIPTKESKIVSPKKDTKFLIMKDSAEEYAKQKGWSEKKKDYTDAEINEVRTYFYNKIYEAINEGYEIKKFGTAAGLTVMLERPKQ